MGALTFDALLRSLKRGAPDPVYYLHGDEDVLKDEAIRAVLERAVEPGARDFNVDQRGAADLDPESLHALVNTPPLLAPARAVILRGVEQVKKTSSLYKELVRYLAAPNPTTVLVLVQGAGEKPDANLVREATAVAVERLPPERVARWMARRAGELGLTIEPEAATLLLEAVRDDLGALALELEKLAGLAVGRATTQADVAALVGVRRGESLGDLVEAALTHQPLAAARRGEPVLDQGGMTGGRSGRALRPAPVGAAPAPAEPDGRAPPAPPPAVA